MGDFVLRNYIRKTIAEYFNNSVVYTIGPDRFPSEENAEKTPSDLAAKFADLEEETEKKETSENPVDKK